MIVSLHALIAELRKEPKFYIRAEVNRMSFYRAAKGHGLSLRTREALLTIARSIWPECIGLLLADGEVHYSSALISEMMDELVRLRRELTELKAEQSPMGMRRYAAPARGEAPRHSVS